MEKLKLSMRGWTGVEEAQASNVFDLLSSRPILHPDKLGPYEPLSLLFKETSREEFVQLVMEERSLVAVRDAAPSQSILWSNSESPRRSSVFSHRFSHNEPREDWVDTFISYCWEMLRVLRPPYGHLCCESDYLEKNVIDDEDRHAAVGNDLKKHLPGIYWANFFGPRYIEFFGEDHLLSAPAHEVRWMDEAGILLMLSDSPLDYAKPEVRRREDTIIEHLGRAAFFSKSDPDDKAYRQPGLSDLPQFSPEAQERIWERYPSLRPRSEE